jgi:hypothetical protein
MRITILEAGYAHRPSEAMSSILFAVPQHILARAPEPEIARVVLVRPNRLEGCVEIPIFQNENENGIDIRQAELAENQPIRRQLELGALLFSHDQDSL